ncbi:hypothetical protein LXT12_26505 [Pelomonas sp. P7]|uniref:DUF4145 domain-containing protein n=1 Tax=Pelomonas caseinilytica TaxID=2906763 RepID=A0ABS8XQD1_9BURK|nr:hypothetical protein [Pelomonas sp. P7]MCE4540786.1 hypothetical protein [Pelomonas sp. P7]
MPKPEAAESGKNRFAQPLKILRKMFLQSWVPLVLALAYACWEFSSASPAQRSAATLIRSWGVTFFLIMWFAGQWFRTAKQIDDAEQLGSLQQRMDESLRLLKLLTDNALDAQPDVVQQGVAALPAAAPNDEPVARVLAEMPKSSKGALLILGAELERELRQLLWTSGWIEGVGKATVSASVGKLVSMGVVPESLGSSVKAFLDIRNRLLHGYGVADDEVLRAVDIGLSILRAVLAIPREEYVVVSSNIDLFEDEAGQTLLPDIRGVLLRTISSNEAGTPLRVFPTRRTNFTPGKRVSWEWNPGRLFGEAWFRDPMTGAMTRAWLSSLEFMGRHLDEIR